jgi:hypothetical protein
MQYVKIRGLVPAILIALRSARKGASLKDASLQRSGDYTNR